MGAHAGDVNAVDVKQKIIILYKPHAVRFVFPVLLWKETYVFSLILCIGSFCFLFGERARAYTYTMVVLSPPNTHGGRGLRWRDVYRRTDKEKKILKNPTGFHANLKIQKVDLKKYHDLPVSFFDQYLFLCAVFFFF